MRKFFLNTEIYMKIQLNFGSNIIIIFNECMRILKISTKKNWNRKIIELIRKKYLYFASLKNRNLLFGITHERIHYPYMAYL